MGKAWLGRWVALPCCGAWGAERGYLFGKGPWRLGCWKDPRFFWGGLLTYLLMLVLAWEVDFFHLLLWLLFIRA